MGFKILDRFKTQGKVDKEKEFRFNAIRLIPFLFLLLGALVYQVQWFTAIDNLYITYDFSHLEGFGTSEVLPSAAQDQLENQSSVSYYSGNIENLFTFFIDEMKGNFTGDILNLTVASEEIIAQNNQIIEDIENEYEIVISQLFDIYTYLTQISPDLIKQFFKEAWLYLLEDLIPDEWNEPGNITLFNDSWMDLNEISISCNFIINESRNLFMNYENVQVPKHKNFLFEINLEQVFSAFLNASLDILVEITYQTFLDYFDNVFNFQLNSFAYYAEELFNKMDIGAEFGFKARMGLLPLNSNVQVDLNKIGEQIFLQEEAMDN